MLRGMSEMHVGAIGFDAVVEVEDDDWERAVRKASGFSVRDLAPRRRGSRRRLIGEVARERA